MLSNIGVVSQLLNSQTQKTGLITEKEASLCKTPSEAFVYLSNIILAALEYPVDFNL